jgi:maleylpyruvate isomerase
MKLYNYFRSSASYRVRIAANLKGIAYEYVSINLGRGESRTPEYEALNPLGRVPTLEENGRAIGQSLAICEYLEETHPQPPLLPRDFAARARIRAIALAVACEIHPLHGGRAQAYLERAFQATEEQRAEWSRYWMVDGFKSIEAMLANPPDSGRFCHGDTPALADVFVVPQVYNAERTGVDMTPFPTIRRIYEECNKVPAFENARPERQTDAA